MIFIFLVMLLLSNYSSNLCAEEEQFGTDSPSTRETLKGIKAVYPLITLEGAAQKLGLDKKELQRDVELKLRMAGIPIASRQEAFDQYLPTLNVLVAVEDTLWEKGIVTKSVEVSLFQDVWLRRDRTKLTSAATWKLGAIGYVQVGYSDYVRQEVKDKVDAFVNAYLSVNPRH